MKLFSALLTIILAITVDAQQVRPRQGTAVAGEFVVKMQGNYNPQAALAAFQAQGLQVKEVISTTMNLWLVKASNVKQEAVTSLTRVRGIGYAQENHYVFLRAPINFMRGLPSDPMFGQQWDMIEGSGISASQVWATATGGKDKGGHDIVVAVVDGGFDLTHEDLRENIWVNRNEIPNNKKDDDGNGYVDDAFGWNALNNSGNITSDMHGTHVMGTVGAHGNNGKGVSGVNWNVKIMAVQGASGTTATVAKAYGYIIEQKKLWYNSKGVRGANVVATNSSFGVDNADCRKGEYPVWNDMYEQMGRLGILSAAATANNNVNVDQAGDVPTGCSSEYIVAVTNTTKENAKFPQAGYGAKSIDLGAPGTNILSTVPGNKYSVLTGTSMATPHVAGAIALIHAAANIEFIQKYYTQPAQAALALKQAMLVSVDQVPSLKGVTVSGGKLNVGKAAQVLNNARWR